MANFIASPSIAHTLYSRNHHPNNSQKVIKIRCNAKTPIDKSSSEPENAFLKIAWYGSEFLGIAASFLRSPPKNGDSATATADVELPLDGLGKIDRAAVVDAIKQDFQTSYFVTGNLSADAYEEECEFADPAGSFRGLNRFKRNCTNFGYLLETSNMKLTKWEDFEDKGIGHWRFRCVMSFPWKPILSGQPLVIQSITSIKNLEKYAGMWNTGMYPKWLFSSKF